MVGVSSALVGGIIVLAVLVSILVNRTLLQRFSHFQHSKRTDAQPRWASQRTPALGGVGFFIILLLAGIAVSCLDVLSALSAGQWMGLTSACILAFAVGLRDDLRGVPPKLKMAAQLLCAGLLLVSGNGIAVFDSAFLNITATIIWVVGLMNAVNMLDNMDGVATITSMFSGLFLLLASLWLNGGFTTEAFLFLALFGALFGFLLFNWHPAKMYMGDAGSLLLGVFLAALAIPNCWNLAHAQHGFGLHEALVPLLVFLMPIVDTTVVTINRLRAGISPSIGGRDHTTHNLVYLGMTDTSVAVTYSFISLINICWALWLIVGAEGGMAIYLPLGWAAFVLLAFYLISRYNMHRGKYSYSK